MVMNRVESGSTREIEAAFLPHQRVHNRFEQGGLNQHGLERFSIMGEAVVQFPVQFPGKASKYLEGKKLETISELDTRKLTYHPDWLRTPQNFAGCGGDLEYRPLPQ
jgi:hypothetical protein